MHQFSLDLDTVSAATLVLHDVLNCLDHKNHCAALFIDLSEAFDTVDQNTLILRLSEIACIRPLACGWRSVGQIVLNA